MDATALAELIKESSAPTGPEPGWQLRLQQSAQGEVRLQEPLARYTSIRIGGPVDAMVLPTDLDSLQNLLEFAKEYRVPWTVLGLGSNVLVRDGGIRGIVIRLNKALAKLEVVEETDQELTVIAEAGVPLPKLVELGRQHALQGVEFLYGIPGSVGGAIWMNAGTRDGEIKDYLKEVTVLLGDGSVVTYPSEKIKFEYRHMRLPSRGIILSGKFSFPKGDPQVVRESLEKYQKRRHDTQPLDSPSLGSVFKNPEKGFAAQMIEELGLKGVRVGGARISEKHANFIVNEGGATAHDVLALIGLIKDKVKEELDVRLELEAKVIGEDEPV